MIKSLKKAFSGKVDYDTAIKKTANAIRTKSGMPEVKSLEDAVSTVIYHATSATKQAAFQEDAAATGNTPAEESYLLPSVLMGMVLTQRMWFLLGENFDGGKVASFVAAGHCLENPGKDSMTVFTRAAMKYNGLRDHLGADDERFNELLAVLIENSDNDAIADTFKPIYAIIREYDNSTAAT